MSFTKAEAAETQKILKAGEEAPHYGVLVPEAIYREMQVDILKSSNLELGLAACIEENGSKPDAHTWGLSGLAIGIITGVLVHAYVTK